MFNSNQELTLDAKARLTIPTKYRADLAPKPEERVVIAAHPRQPCLMVFSPAEWDYFLRPLMEASTAEDGVAEWKEWLTTFSEHQEVDAAGRIVVSPGVRTHTGLKVDSKVVFAGAGFRCHVWDLDLFMEHNSNTVAQLRKKPIPTVNGFTM